MKFYHREDSEFPEEGGFWFPRSGTSIRVHEDRVRFRGELFQFYPNSEGTALIMRHRSSIGGVPYFPIESDEANERIKNLIIASGCMPDEMRGL